MVLFDSEGDILMSLGMLATIAEQAPANFYHFLLDNECYATTGGQPVPNAKTVAYDVLARGAGYPRAFAFTELAEFSQNLPKILAQPGPVFVALKVLPEVENTPIGRRSRWQTRTRDKVVQDLRWNWEFGEHHDTCHSSGSSGTWRSGCVARGAHAEGGKRFVTANNSGYDTLDPHVVFDIGRIGSRLNMYDCLVRWVDNPPKLQCGSPTRSTSRPTASPTRWR